MQHQNSASTRISPSSAPEFDHNDMKRQFIKSKSMPSNSHPLPPALMPHAPVVLDDMLIDDAFIKDLDGGFSDLDPRFARDNEAIYHVPCYSRLRREDDQQNKSWMNMMSGGFTQFCSNWSLIKMLLPSHFVEQMTTTYLPAIQLLQQRTDSAVSVSKENVILEPEVKIDSPSRLVLIGALNVKPLVYAVTWLVELLYYHTIKESRAVMSKKFFNIKCVLPRSSISRFIGRGGETIRKVQEESRLSMSVSTLDREISERVLNMGFFLRESADASAKLDSLLSVYQVIVHVLQTDRNYSINYIPIPENLGRQCVEAKSDERGLVYPTRTNLVELIKASDTNRNGIHFDDISDVYAYTEADARKCLAHLEDSVPLCPAPSQIIEQCDRVLAPMRYSEITKASTNTTSSSTFDNSTISGNDVSTAKGGFSVASSAPFVDWNSSQLFSMAGYPYFDPSTSHPLVHNSLNKSLSNGNIQNQRMYQNPPHSMTSINKSGFSPLPRLQQSQQAHLPAISANYGGRGFNSRALVKLEMDLSTGVISGQLDLTHFDLPRNPDVQVFYCPLNELSDQIINRIHQQQQAYPLTASTANDSKPSTELEEQTLHHNPLMGTHAPSWVHTTYNNNWNRDEDSF